MSVVSVSQSSTVVCYQLQIGVCLCNLGVLLLCLAFLHWQAERAADETPATCTSLSRWQCHPHARCAHHSSPACVTPVKGIANASWTSASAGESGSGGLLNMVT